ncbi:MAG: trigger factor [Acidobacteriota bacterium]|nr:trigger factor [Acidobacteriota bacterium]
MEQNVSQERLKVISPVVRELEIEIQPEEVKKEYEKVVNNYVARIKLPGFRRGHAPREMVARMFAAEIKETILDNLVPEYLKGELESVGVIPVNVPTVKLLDFDLEKGIRFQVTFEVWPAIDLPASYLENKVKEEEVKIEEKEIEEVLKNLQANAAEYLPVNDRPVAKDDYVVIEIQAKDLEARKFMPADKVVVLAGHPENESQLNEALIGLRQGEEKTFLVEYPSDYAQKKFAGKKIEYRIKVMEIKEKKLPEINDELARTIDQVSGLEELKEKIRQDMLKHRQQEIADKALNEFLEKLASDINLSLPDSLVKEEEQAIIRRQFKEDDWSKMPVELRQKVEEQARKQAEKNLKNHFLLRKIIEKEGLKVSEEEYAEDLKKIAEERNIPLNRLKSALDQEEREEEWKLNLLLQKGIDFLKEKVIIK